MNLSVRIDCTPGEARQLVGAADLLPLQQVLALALEDWLVCLIARLDPTRPAPGPGDGERERDGI